MIKLKRFLSRALLVLISMLIAVCLFESFLRIISYSYCPLEIKVARKADWRGIHSNEDIHFIYDSSLIWRPRKNFQCFNSAGFRGRELKAAQNHRIFAIGDSNTLGIYNGPNWPAELDRKVSAQDERYIVENAGVVGYTSFQGLRLFRRILPLKPEIALISFGANDAHRVYLSDEEYMRKRRINDALDGALGSLRIGQLFMAVLDRRIYQGAEKLKPRVSAEEYRRNLKEIIDISRKRRIQVILLTRPYLNLDPNPPAQWWIRYAEDYNRLTREIARNEKVPCIDIYSRFEGNRECFLDEAHFNEKGHRIAAETIYMNIKPLIR
jgi:lysophospholipase L1-like esterase